MTKPKRPAPARDRSGALYVLLETSELESLDAWAARLNSGGAIPAWTRTALVKAIFRRALRERGVRGQTP